ncbi:MAG TPA: DUF4382 domain-containing protein [Chitinophagaceae bacterium]
MKFRNTLAVLGFATAVSVIAFSCTKNDSSASSGKAQFQVYLTDDPGEYDAVNIDVKDILINYSVDSSSGWQSLGNVKTGIYDILKLVNDKDTMLASADIKAGRIQQIRLVLGTNNTVMIDSVTYPLQTPSAQQSGLKLNIHQDVNADITYKLLLDFDASRSIVRTGNGKYILKPVIRTTLQATGGTLKGFVRPDSVQTAVYAIKGTDTFGTYTSNGSWAIKSLSAGSYNLLFVPGDTTFQTASKTGISVTTGQVTVVDTVTLVK